MIAASFFRLPQSLTDQSHRRAALTTMARGDTLIFMSDNLDERTKIAAGGVVVQKRDDGTIRVLVVHRPRYDDWSFPKGKAGEGETLEQTALREVREETGIECRILRELSIASYSYLTRGGEIRPKRVHYFLMEQASGDLQTDGSEVDLIEWLEPEEAARRLTYEHDRKMLNDLPAEIK